MGRRQTLAPRGTVERHALSRSFEVQLLHPTLATISSRSACFCLRSACSYRARCRVAYSRKLARVTVPSSAEWVTVTSDPRGALR